MKSLNQYINEVSSDLLKRAHNEQVRRNGGVESNRSRKFAKGAHAALDREMSLDDSVSGTERHYDYVDLGLPSGTMWATCNVGATKPEDPGLLFQFGRVDGYRYGDRNNKFTTDDLTTASGKVYKKNEILNLSDDAAHVNMGGKWRMPTCDELKELIGYTTKKVTTINGTKGRLFTSDINGNNLFIPFDGYWYNNFYGNAYHARIWSSQVDKFEANCSCCLSDYTNSVTNVSINDNVMALAVRGVFKK